MKKERISETISNISENYVNEASAYTGAKQTARRPNWVRWTAVAASLVLVLTLGIFGITHFLGDDEMQGIYIEDREPVFGIITEWKDEGFVCTIADPSIHEFISEGYSVLILFNENTKVKTLDGSDFAYDSENPNAPSCGLPVGTTVEIYFTGVNYKADGMAHSLDATEIIPQN